MYESYENVGLSGILFSVSCLVPDTFAAYYLYKANRMQTTSESYIRERTAVNMYCIFMRIIGYVIISVADTVYGNMNTVFTISASVSIVMTVMLLMQWIDIRRLPYPQS